MQKIKRVSFLFRILLQIVFIAIPIVLILFWICAPTPIPAFAQAYGAGISFIPADVNILAPLTPEIKFYGFLICLLPVGIVELMIYFLIKLFYHYEQGEIFTFDSVRLIKRTGWALLIGQIVINPIFEALISWVLTLHNPPHYRYATISVHAINIGLILIAFLMVLISWIMAEACKLSEEQALTV